MADRCMPRHRPPLMTLSSRHSDLAVSRVLSPSGGRARLGCARLKTSWPCERVPLERGGQRMTSWDYTDPVAKLLTYGGLDNNRRDGPWPDYRELGLNSEHVPDLIRMTMDMDLNDSSQDRLEVWAPLHAWRALGQLKAEEAAEPLVRLFERLEDDDWVPRELPKVFSMIGPGTIPAIAAFLGDHDVEQICRISVPECLERIAKDHPENRDECAGILMHQLERYETNGPGLNAFLVLSLTNLGAVDAIGVIRKAFSADCVDLLVQGDIEDVEIEMSLRTSRSSPRSDPNPFRNLLDPGGEEPRRNTSVRRPMKVGRNDPCPCGSGKKFKKCCLNLWDGSLHS